MSRSRVWQKKTISVWKLTLELKNAKKDDKKRVYKLWIEEDYFYFVISHGKRKCARQILHDIVIEIVESEEANWAKIKDKTSIWI